jgi:hypothetical protein
MQVKAAVFIDAENHADLHVPDLMQQLGHLQVIERHAYADWRNRRLDRLAEQLEQAEFEMHHTWSGRRPGMQKNKADNHVARGISRTLSRQPEIKMVVIVSGDGFFIAIAQELRKQGKQVVIAADPYRVSHALRRTADGYLPVGKQARWIQSLERLERANQYLTFSFVVKNLGIKPDNLSQLINSGNVIQKEISRPRRGVRRELFLNYQAPIVQAVRKGGVINPR